MTKLIIIGAGPAGTAAALKSAEAGWETILIEKDKLGGTCLQRGCIPTKALLEEAHLLNLARHKFGEIDVDETAMFARKDKLVFELTATLTQQIQVKKIRVVNGEARFLDAHTIEVNGESITADLFLIAAGSQNRVFDFPGNAQLWTSDEALFTPLKGRQRVLLIGGGVIGIELAAYYHELGHRVTILEKENRILPNVPKDLVQSIVMDYKKEGIRILTSVAISKITQTGHYTVEYNDNTEDFDVVVLCAGRIPATASLHLEKAGIRNEKGLIVVDENYRTNIPHIHAVGDASCRVQLAHVATRQANDVMDHLTQGKACSPFVIPSAIYTPIQAAWAGKSEDELKAQGIPYTAYRQPLGALAKSKIKGDGRRYISVSLDDHNRLLGVSLYLSEASELLPFFTFLMEYDLPFTQAGDIVYPHPTLSEAIGELAALIWLKTNQDL
jgi:dihydrolipoamide dehydrogenase